jgi:hypothetical protein
MVDNDMNAGHQAVQRAKAATKTDTLGPGTAGFTTSGAAYRGKEIASTIGVPSPEATGFTTDSGLGYVSKEATLSGYEPAQPTE